MIDVEELNTFVKAHFYWLNHHEYEKYVDVLGFDKDRWRKLFENEEKLPDFSYFLKFGLIMKKHTSESKCGHLYNSFTRVDLLLFSEPLSLYPKMLYDKGYLTKKNDDLREVKYFFMYFPKAKCLNWVSGPSGVPSPSARIKRAVCFGASFIKNERWIAYNVTLPLTIENIIHEELHALGAIHDFHPEKEVEKIIRKINSKEPSLKHEIIDGLSRTSSLEENKFKQLGNSLQEKYSSELSAMNRFVQEFECSIREKPSARPSRIIR